MMPWGWVCRDTLSPAHVGTRSGHTSVCSWIETHEVCDLTSAPSTPSPRIHVCKTVCHQGAGVCDCPTAERSHH